MQHFHRRHLFPRTGFLTRILIINLIIIICSFALTGGLIYQNLHRHLFENELLLAQETHEKLRSFLEEKQNMVFGQYTAMHTLNNIADLFGEIHEGTLDPYNSEVLRFTNTYLASILTADSDISDFVFIGPDGSVYSRSSHSTRFVSPSFDFHSYPLLETLRNSERNFIVDYDDQLTYLSGADGPVITYASKIFQMDNLSARQVIGYFLINFPVQGIYDTFAEYFEGSNSQLYYLNSDNRILFSSNLQRLGETYVFPEDDHILTQQKIVDISGSQVVMELDDRAPLRSIAGIRDYFITILLLAIAAISLATFILHRAMHQRLDQLAHSMERVRDGDLNQRLPVTGSDEISLLSEQFNQMCNRLQRFISLNYVAETQKRLAQINALQAQINPHFLYNTIDGIRAKVLDREHSSRDDVAEMLVMLAHLFRYSADISENIVYLEDEISYVESYLEMQHIRFGDGFHYDIHVQSDLLYMGIPKLILQPLIENAIVHGLSGREYGAICVGVTTGNKNLILTIEDNGCGIAPEQVAQLNQYLNSDAMEPDMRLGIGIKNVHDRIRLLFSGTSGIAVTSSPGVGTRIIISLPAMTKEKMQQCIES